MGDEDIFGGETFDAATFDPTTEASFINYGYESPPDLSQGDVGAGAIENFITSTAPVATTAANSWNWGAVIGGVASVITRGVTGSQTITQQSAAQRTAQQMAAQQRLAMTAQARNRWLVPALILGGGYLFLKS